MSERSFRRSVARVIVASLACIVCFGCVSAVGPTPQAAPPPPSKTQSQSDCQAQGGQATSDCTKKP